jgi:nitrous oxide reductase accessory protein NosL
MPLPLLHRHMCRLPSIFLIRMQGFIEGIILDTQESTLRICHLAEIMIDVFPELPRGLDAIVCGDFARITDGFGGFGRGDGFVGTLATGDGDVF